MTELPGEPALLFGIHFLRPLWFLALLPLPWVLWRLGRTNPGAEAWRGLVDAHLLRHLLVEEPGRARPLPLVLLALGWLLGVAALAGPAWERLPQPLFEAQAQRVIVLDLSPDMDAQDLAPSRLARARFEVLDLLAAASEGQTALLAYGAEPFIVAPLTRDAATIAAQVPDLETALLPVKGPKRTDLALAEAGANLTRAGSQEGDIILITADPGSSEALHHEVARLRDLGYRTSVLGLGTEKGAPVPLAGGGFATDAQGGIRLARLRPDQLREIATLGGGRYVSLTADDADTRALLPEVRPAAAPVELRDAVSADRWREEGPWLLLALLPLAALAFRRGWLSPWVLLVALVGGLPPPAAQALAWEDLWWRADQQAARALAAGDARQAAERFQRPDWRAAAQYEAGDYGQALEGLKDQPGPEAAYNRGNALARSGKLQEAIAEYDRALAEVPDHADARFNRDLVQGVLDRQSSATQPGSSPPSSSSSSDPSSAAGQSQAGQAAQEEQDQGSQTGQGRKHPKGQASQERPDQGGQQTPSDPNAGQDEQAGQAGQAQSDPGDQAPRSVAGASRQEQTGQPVQAQPDLGGQVTPSGAAEGQEEPPPAGAATGEPQAPLGPEPRQEEEMGASTPANPPPRQDGDPADQPTARRESGPGKEPDRQDLLGGPPSAASSSPLPNPGQSSSQVAPVPPTEDQQALEQQLRRVPDDPGGLLRQRFLLQHLRRQGQ